MKNRAVMAVASGYFQSPTGGFIGGKYNRNATLNWQARANSADTDILNDLPALRGRSRDLVRNTPLATGAVGTMASNVIGSGLSLLARPDLKTLKMSDEEGDAWIDNTEREFRIFAESTECDICRTQNFYGLQMLGFRAMLESGDVFALLPVIVSAYATYGTRIQIIEADRIENPRGPLGVAAPFGADPLATSAVPPLGENPDIRAGIELNKYGAPVAYHVWDRFPNELSQAKASVARIPAFDDKTGRRNVVHSFVKERPGQTRGVPFLAPVIEQLKTLDKYTESELMAAVVTAMFTVFIKTENGTGIGDTPQQKATPLFDKTNNVGMGPAAMVDLNQGEDVAFANPLRPNTAFDPFVQAILRQIGVALGLPFEVLIKHFTASYSAARAALLQAWLVFKQRRDFMAQNFCHPIYAAWMDEAVALGRISAPGYFDDPALKRAYRQAEWIGDAPGQIDPLKEIQAADERIRVGVSDLAAETMEITGRVWLDVHKQQVKEKNLRVKDGLELAVGTPAVPGGPPVGPGDPAQDKRTAPVGPGVPPLPTAPKPKPAAASDAGDKEKETGDGERGDHETN